MILLAVLVVMSFEVSLAGFVGYHGATLARVNEGFDGAWSVIATGTGDFGIDDSPSLIGRTVQGVTYTYSAWVRGSGRVEIQLREYNLGAKVGATVLAPLTLSTGWQKVTGKITAGKSGSLIDFQVRARSGSSFQVDAITVSDATADRWVVADIPAIGYPDCDTSRARPIASPQLKWHVFYVGPESKSFTKNTAPGPDSFPAPRTPGTYRILHYTSNYGIPSCAAQSNSLYVPAPGPQLYGRPYIQDLRVLD